MEELRSRQPRARDVVIPAPQGRHRSDRVRMSCCQHLDSLRCDGGHGRHAPRGDSDEHGRLVGARGQVVGESLACPHHRL
eukprot:11206640-Lingulodinium_polyedra.AAC.1